MNHESRDTDVMSYLRRRASEEMPRDFVPSVMAEVRQTPQRRPWSPWPILAGAATVAAGIAVVGVALSLARPADVAVGPSGTASPTPSAATSVHPSPSPSPATTATPSPSAAPTPGVSATDPAAGAFTCSLPITRDVTQYSTQIVDVRVGTHSGYDRIVFEFVGGVPAFEIEEAAPPFYQDGSGNEFDVSGSSHRRVILRGASRMGTDGSLGYTGPNEIAPGFPQLVELEQAGDFEAVSTWVIGLASDACIRVLTLSGPDRLVIDVEHP